MEKQVFIIYRFGVDKGFREYDIAVGAYEATDNLDAINQHAEKSYESDQKEFMKGYLKAIVYNPIIHGIETKIMATAYLKSEGIDVEKLVKEGVETINDIIIEAEMRQALESLGLNPKRVLNIS